MSCRAKSGEVFNFRISRDVCEPFGFFPGTRVNTPKGPATVIGVYNQNLWFHIDNDKGASFWDTGISYEALLGLGITIIPENEIEPDVKKGEYRTKRIEYEGRSVTIILQNENGPCPLIAIANILALRNSIQINDSKGNQISVSNVVEKIVEFLRQKFSKDAEKMKQVEDLIKVLPDLQVGLDVNFNFLACDGFESSEKSKIFDLLQIRMVHGWIIDPQMTQERTVIKSLTYNDLMFKLVALAEGPSKVVGTPTKSESSLKESLERDKPFTQEEGVVVNNFLSSTSHQLTEFGLKKLHETLHAGELAIFFRNNHFTTLTKKNGLLFNLVTDIGYERERLVVWDLLSKVDGDSCFFSCDFSQTDEVKKAEVMNTCLEFGFSKDKIEQAIKAVFKPNEELSIDEVLDWLNKHAASDIL